MTAVLLSVLILLLSTDTMPASLEARQAVLMAPADSSKNPTRALLLSLGATAVPIGVGAALWGENPNRLTALLFAGGTILGPAAGHFYARHRARTVRGILIRAGGAAVTAGGLVVFISSVSGGEGADAVGTVGLFAALGGLGVAAVSGAYDVVQAPRSARAYNRRQVQMSVRPAVDPVHRAAGLSLRVGF